MRSRLLSFPFQPWPRLRRPSSLLLASALAASGLLHAPAAAQSGEFEISAEADSRKLAPLRVDFAAQVPAGVSVRWNFGDGSPAEQGSRVSHTYYRPGRYAAQVSLSRDGRELGRSQVTLEVRGQGNERAGLVVLLGRGNVALSDAGSVVYAPYRPQFTLDGQPVSGTVAVGPGTHTATVQIAAAGGTLRRSVRFALPSGELRASPTYEEQVLQAINRLRESGYNCATGRSDGVVRPKLTRVPTLDRAALAHALAMPVMNFVNHTSQLDGSTPAQRIEAAGYPPASTAENIAAGQPTPAEAVAGWLGSPGHCASLTGNYTQTGLSYVQVPGSPYEHYWVQVFGRP